MKYRIAFYEEDKLIRKTTFRFNSWNDAEYYLNKVLKYKFSIIDAAFTKHKTSAKIIAANGIPF